MDNSLPHRYRHIRFENDRPYRRFISTSNGLRRQHTSVASSFITSHGPYRGDLLKREWIERRKQILARDQYRCRACGSSENLQVHHRQYHFVVRRNRFKLPWEYQDRLLITLCERCNQKGHSKYKVPTINI